MTFEEMSFKEKADHIWEYYKLHIISGIVGLLIAFSFLNVWVLNPEPENVMDLTFRTQSYDYDLGTELQDELTALLIEDGVNETAIVDYLPTGDDRDFNTLQATEAKFIGKIETGDMDIIVFEEGLMHERMTDPMALYDLDVLEKDYGVTFPEELKIYMVDAETGNEGAYMLDVNKMPRLYNLAGALEGVQYYVGVFLRADDLDKTTRALEYLTVE